MARRMSAPSEKVPASGKSAPASSEKPGLPEAGAAGGARADLLARGAANAAGAYCPRSDALADAKAARAVAQLLATHERELSRRGLGAAVTQAALQLADEIEDHLQALPAAAISVRERSQDDAELLAEAAQSAQAVREAVLRVTRHEGGRAVAHAFGLGEPFSARQHADVRAALERILAGARAHPATAADIGLGEDDLQTIGELARDLSRRFGELTRPDEHRQLLEAQAGLRAFFDLVAAKALIAFAGDPDERGRLLALLPRADDRRHVRRPAEVAHGA